MIVATISCYFSFLYFYLAKNDLAVLAKMRLPSFICSPPKFLPWTVLALSLLPYWWQFGFEVGVSLWLLVLSGLSLLVVLVYPFSAPLLLRCSKWLFFISLAFGMVHLVKMEW